MAEQKQTLTEAEFEKAMRDAKALETMHQKPNLVGYPFSSVAKEDLTSVSYLIKGVTNKGDIAFWFGDSGVLKSFIVTDVAFHVAHGRDWHGHRVRQTGVLIVIAEGQAGYKKRLKAIMAKYGTTTLPIWIVPEPVALDYEADTLTRWLEMAEAELGCEIGLVVMDTFSLMLGDGDESSNSDVSLSLNALRKAVTGRAVMLVHHTGHGDKGRERGAYQIRGNADVRILIERDESGTGDVLTVTNLKNKDDRLFDPINLTFEVVHLGLDEDGDSVTSLVIAGTEMLPVATDSNSRKRKALDYVREAISLCGSNQRELVRDSFAGLYPSKNLETIRSAFRKGWNEYTAILTQGGRDGW